MASPKQTLERIGLDPLTLLAGVPRKHRRAVLLALQAIAHTSVPAQALETEMGRAVLANDTHVEALRLAGTRLVDELREPGAALGSLRTIGHLVPLSQLPAEAWSEVRANPAQQEDWTNVFGSSDPETDWPVDTRHFDNRFSIETEPRGVAILSENLLALSCLSTPFRTVYIDPPYNTGGSRYAYRDRVPDVEWLAALRRRLELSARLLTLDGTTWVQVDHHAPAGLDEMLQSVFSGGIQNKVVWAYGGSGRGAKAVSGRLPRNYDTLYLCATDAKQFRLNKSTVQITVPKEEAPGRGFRFADGRWFKTAPRGDYSDESIARLEREGRIFRTERGTLRIKYFLREEDGHIIEDRMVGDVWTDIPDMMHAPHQEWTGFPSQKPVALIRRVIELSSAPDEAVLDFYAGTGTTTVAALELGRRFCVIESGPHFESVLLPRIKRALAQHPGVVEIQASQ